MSRLVQLQKLAAVQPDDPLIQYGIGLELANREQWLEALAAFEQTLKIDPQYVAAWFQRARAQIKLGRKTEAVETLRTGIAHAEARGDRHSADEMRKTLEALL